MIDTFFIFIEIKKLSRESHDSLFGVDFVIFNHQSHDLFSNYFGLQLQDPIPESSPLISIKKHWKAYFRKRQWPTKHNAWLNHAEKIKELNDLQNGGIHQLAATGNELADAIHEFLKHLKENHFNATNNYQLVYASNGIENLNHLLYNFGHPTFETTFEASKCQYIDIQSYVKGLGGIPIDLTKIDQNKALESFIQQRLAHQPIKIHSSSSSSSSSSIQYLKLLIIANDYATKNGKDIQLSGSLTRSKIFGLIVLTFILIFIFF